MTPVTLQINLAPSDARLVGLVLRHQMKQCGSYADEVMLTLDLRLVGRSHEFRATWEANKASILATIDEIQREFSNVRVAEVDRSPDTARAVSEAFFGGRSIPAVDYRGRPFYSYFFGLFSAAHDHVLHLDADMLLGGGSPTWLSEAVAVLRERPNLMSCSPFPGPPTPNFELLTQTGRPVSDMRAAYTFPHFSSRIFFLDRSVFRDYEPARVLLPQPRRAIPRALLARRPAVASAEETISRHMRRTGLERLDFLGRAPGLWGLHPPYRSEKFYRTLPDIVRMVEDDDLPEGQLGDYDVNDSVVDWSDARAELAAARWRL